jgi:alkanesulfonate monooxygenase SsuD/methylene tetrahydromethanopterin reductase-like flavin-dependent oxidoreductase (luciferase family)
MSRRLALFAEFHHSGDHEGAWRLPTAEPARVNDVDYYRQFAQTAADGKFDSLFFADFLAFDEQSRHYVRWPFEPTTLLSALASSVPDIGVVATGSTVYSDAPHIARTFATLQEASGGRAGWNIVTTGALAAARAYGRSEAPDHGDRYAAAYAVVDQVIRSWADDYGLAGTRRPVLVQAGASDAGRNFAAKHGEVIFTATPDIESGIAFRQDIRARAAAHGRDPDEIRVLPGVLAVLGETEAAARRLRGELDANLSDGTVRGVLASYGVEVPAEGLDQPLSGPLGDAETFNGIKSRLAVLERIAGGIDEPVTLRRLVHEIAGSRGHLRQIGTPESVADTLIEWFERGAADGFVVKFSHNPGGARDFVDGVIPILQKRGHFRKDYEGETLRERLNPGFVSSRAGRTP